MEQNALSNILIRTLGVSAAAVALGLFVVGASAQTPPAKKDPAPKAVTKKPPACNSLKDEAACKARTDCNWVSAVINEKTKKQTRAAYCRTKPVPPKKVDPKKVDPKKG